MRFYRKKIIKVSIHVPIPARIQYVIDVDCSFTSEHI